MTRCQHRHLALIPPETGRLRCRHCHLTIKQEEIGSGHCPECYEVHGKKRYDFEPLSAANTPAARYRCEDCGITIDSG